MPRWVDGVQTRQPVDIGKSTAKSVCSESAFDIMAFQFHCKTLLLCWLFSLTCTQSRVNSDFTLHEELLVDNYWTLSSMVCRCNSCHSNCMYTQYDHNYGYGFGYHHLSLTITITVTIIIAITITIIITIIIAITITIIITIIIAIIIIIRVHTSTLSRR